MIIILAKASAGIEKNNKGSSMNIWQKMENFFFYEEPISNDPSASNASISSTCEPKLPPGSLVTEDSTQDLRAPSDDGLFARVGKRVSGEQFTKVHTPSGAYEILSQIKPNEHPLITQHLTTSGGHDLEPKNQSHSIKLGQGSFGIVRFAAHKNHPVCVVKRTNDAAGKKELNAVKLLQRIPKKERSLFVQTFDGVQALGNKGKVNTYIFQEYMAQGDLSSEESSAKLKSSVVDDWKPAMNVKLAKALCAPVAALHRAGLYHRDIKPENYLMNEGQIKLGDFGFLTDQKAPGKASGTLPFLPPEYRSKDLQSDQSDAFALGVMLYDIAEGLHPAEDFSACNNVDLGWNMAFLQSCNQSTTDNKTRPTLSSIALQLMHPTTSERLTVEQAMKKLDAVQV